MSSLRNFMHWPLKAVIFASWFPAIIFFNDHIGEVTWISGVSMYPYFNGEYNSGLTKDVCWIRKWKPREDLKRGMIVSFRSPSHPELWAVKRVIALEGDTVTTRAPHPIPKVQVPIHHVWVEGDNPDMNKTLDSNTYGAIPMNLIEGRVTRLLWPRSRAGPLSWEDWNSRRVVKQKKMEHPGFMSR